MADIATIGLKVDSKGVVTAVKDLDKLSKQGKITQDNLRANARVIGQAAGIIGTAFVGAVTTATVQTINLANETARLSALSNTMVEDFQRNAFAVSTVGIQSDKLADIYKDMQDRIGDFLQTGGGPLVDFFDNIAPKIGVTIDQFNNLSGAEGLQLFVDSLEKANVSQSEMVFYMESIAGESSRLIPLLRNGGEAMDALGDAAENAGSVMSQDTIVQAQRLGAAIDLMQVNAQGFKTQIGTALIPVLADLAVEFGNVTNSGTLAATISDGIIVGFKGIAGAAIVLGTAVNAAGKSLGGLAALATKGRLDYTNLFTNPIDELNKFGSALTSFGSDATFIAQDIGDDLRSGIATLDALFEAGTGNAEAGSEALKRILEAQAANRALMADMDRGGSEFNFESTQGQQEASAAAAKAADQLAMSYRQVTSDLSNQRTELLMNERELFIHQATMRLSAGASADMVKNTQDLAGALFDEREALEQSADAKDRAAAILMEMETPMDEYIARLKEIADLEKVSALTAEEANNARLQAIDVFAEASRAAGQSSNEMSEFMKEAAGNIQNILADNLFDFMQGEFELTADSFTQMINRMVAEAAAADIAQSLFGSLVEGGSGGGLLGKALGAAGSLFGFGGGSSVASIAAGTPSSIPSLAGLRADGGPVDANKSYLVGERGPEIITPRQSGTVIPNNQMQAAGGMSIVVNISGVRDGRDIRQSADQAAMKLMAAGQRAMQRNG